MATCVKVTMVIFNVILAVAGLAAGIAGAVLYHKPELVGDLGLKDDLEKLDGNEHLDGSGLFLTAAVFGFLVFAVSFFGCIGAACDSVCALVTYIVLVMILTIVCLIIGSMAIVATDTSFGRDKVKTFYTKNFQKNLKGRVYYQNVTANVTAGVDAIQRKFNCCGCHNKTEYVDENNKTVADQLLPLSCKGNQTHRTPFSAGCCDVLPELVIGWVTPYFRTVGILLLIAAVIEILAIIFAFVACCSLRQHPGPPHG